MSSVQTTVQVMQLQHSPSSLCFDVQAENSVPTQHKHDCGTPRAAANRLTQKEHAIPTFFSVMCARFSALTVKEVSRAGGW
jgi:hypothetical protein